MVHGRHARASLRVAQTGHRVQHVRNLRRVLVHGERPKRSAVDSGPRGSLGRRGGRSPERRGRGQWLELILRTSGGTRGDAGLGERGSSHASTRVGRVDVGRGQRRCRDARRFIGRGERRGARGAARRTAKSDGEGARRPRRATEADMFGERARVRGACVSTCGRLGISAGVFSFQTGFCWTRQVFFPVDRDTPRRTFACSSEEKTELTAAGRGARVTLGGDARAGTMSNQTSWRRRYATYLLCAGAGYYGTTRPTSRNGSPIQARNFACHTRSTECSSTASTRAPHRPPSPTCRFVHPPLARFFIRAAISACRSRARQLATATKCDAALAAWSSSRDDDGRRVHRRRAGRAHPRLHRPAVRLVNTPERRCAARVSSGVARASRARHPRRWAAATEAPETPTRARRRRSAWWISCWTPGTGAWSRF